jgi:hypothetical protein
MTTNLGTLDLGSYTNIETIEFLFKVYKQCGKTHEELVIEDMQQGIMNINILMTAWAKYNNLYSFQSYMYNLLANQSAYLLPLGVVDVPPQEVSVAQITRQLGGTAFSSAGSANAPFDGIGSSSCNAGSNGNIGYIFPFPQSISYVGIQTPATATYTLSFQYSYNATTYAAGQWITVLETNSQMYYAGQQTWYVVPVPQSASYFRIIETGGATLVISQLYFSFPYQSRILSPMTRSEYISLPTKNTMSDVTSYYLNRSQNPYLYLWPVPTLEYPYLVLNAKIAYAQVVNLTDIITIPNRFYDALFYGVSMRCAEEIAPDRYDKLSISYSAALKGIEEEDTEHNPIRFYFTM